MRFAKGHGTGNDFVILPDPADELVLTAGMVRRLCDRRTGLGADGVLRVVPAATDGMAGIGRSDTDGMAGISRTPERPAGAAGTSAAGPGTVRPRWFMDYRNADGSSAEMCGNGIRVFVRYLIDAGLEDGPDVAVATRAGTRLVRQLADGRLSVNMGPALARGSGRAVIGGRTLTGLAVSVGNPHLACLVTEPLAGFDLSQPPGFDARQFPDGVNVELIRVTGKRQIELRVYERGSGVTLSCGTGAVAAAVAAEAGSGEWPAARAGQCGGLPAAGDGEQTTGTSAPEADRAREKARPGQWTVLVPGGEVLVAPDPAASILTGPAEIVAEGMIRAGWLAGP